MLQKLAPNLFNFCMTNVENLGNQGLDDLLETLAFAPNQNLQKLQISMIPINEDRIQNKFA
jgi:hypothetical protein